MTGTYAPPEALRPDWMRMNASTMGEAAGSIIAAIIKAQVAMKSGAPRPIVSIASSSLSISMESHATSAQAIALAARSTPMIAARSRRTPPGRTAVVTAPSPSN